MYTCHMMLHCVCHGQCTSWHSVAQHSTAQRSAAWHSAAQHRSRQISTDQSGQASHPASQGQHGLAMDDFTSLVADSLCPLVARELLRLGSEVVMVGNTMPAINDITATELIAVVEDVTRFCPTIKVGIHSSLSCWLQWLAPYNVQGVSVDKYARCVLTGSKA